MKVLVTGANGYLGQGIVKRLLDDGAHIIAADITLDYVDKRAQLKASNIFEIENPREYYGYPDILLHLAWRNGFEHNADSHLEDLPLHYHFIKKMVEGGVCKIAVMGSMHEIGFYEGSIDDDTLCCPMNLYGIAKDALRKAVTGLAANSHVPVQWLRGYYIVGNSKFGNSIFSKITAAAEKGQKTFPFTSGQNQYDFLDYDEFCLQVAATVEQDTVTGIINICSGVPEKLCDRVERFIRGYGYDIKLDYGAFPDRTYDSMAVWGNNRKIRAILRQRVRKILVTGAQGQLGHDVVTELNKRHYESVGIDINELDITDTEAVDRVVSAINPDAVIHCAAWTAVDAAEEEANIQQVLRVNATGTENIAQVCRKLGCKMMYISTDYVFDGQGIEPWVPDCKDFKPLNVYGRSKLEGENSVYYAVEKFFIVRIAWAFGVNGKNFIRTILNLSKTGDEIKVVNDQIGTPTYTYDLARLLVDMIISDSYGYYHATNEGGYISWYDFACEIIRQAGIPNVKVIPVTTADYGASKTRRPFNSRLEKSKLIQNGFEPLPAWQDALARYLKELKI